MEEWYYNYRMAGGLLDETKGIRSRNRVEVGRGKIIRRKDLARA